MSNKKCVIVIDQDLPVGVIANAAAVLALSVGKSFPEIIGEDHVDNRGHNHRGITTLPIPILKRNNVNLNALRESLKAAEPELGVIDLTSATQTTRSYEDYCANVKATPVEQVRYLGIALYGDAKTVTKFTGSLGLLR